MRLRIKVILCLLVLAALALANCRPKQGEPVEIRAYPLDTSSGVITQSGVELDKGVTSDGNGSLKLTAGSPTTFRLFETGDLDLEDNRLVYRARMRTLDIAGEAYLEMWCHFPGKGEFFSRGLQAPLSGTTEWTTEEIAFFLKRGENPDNVKLNVVVNGTGTVWIDDIRLSRDF